MHPEVSIATLGAIIWIESALVGTHRECVDSFVFQWGICPFCL